MNRHCAVQEILRFGPQREQAFDILLQPADQPAGPVYVTAADLSAILQRCLDNQLDADDLDQWVTLIECRDEFDSSAIEDYLYALSNPELMGGISNATLSQMVTLLADA